MVAAISDGSVAGNGKSFSPVLETAGTALANRNTVVLTMITRLTAAAAVQMPRKVRSPLVKVGFSARGCGAASGGGPAAN